MFTLACVGDAWWAGGIPESVFCENSEFVNPQMRETLSFHFQKER